MPDPEHVKEIFARYARLRQSRASREEAWKLVRPDADHLTEEERKRVMALVRDWEIIEGHRYRTVRSDDPYATLYKAPEGLKALREQLKEDQAFQAKLQEEVLVDLNDTKEFVIKKEDLRTAQPTPPKAPVAICLSCQHANPVEATKCEKCGATLIQTHDLTSAAERQVARAESAASTNIEPDMALRLEFTETGQILRVPMTLEQMVIGRAAAGSLMPPDIDLSAFDAQRKGVSRYHASLQRRGETLLLTDLQSLNHTYINGQRLIPHEVRALRDGDELRLGQLTMHVFFLKL